MSSSNCCFLTCIQISQEAGQVVWYSHLLKSFPQFIVIHTVKGFGIVNKAEVDVFLVFSCFFNDPTDVAIWSLVPLPFLNPPPTLEVHGSCTAEAWLGEFEHYFASMWDECNCVVVWAFFDIVFLWDWNENWPFPVLWKILSCGKFLKRWESQAILHASWEIYMQVKKQQLELDMEQQTDSKLGKEYVKAVYCHLLI